MSESIEAENIWHDFPENIVINAVIDKEIEKVKELAGNYCLLEGNK